MASHTRGKVLQLYKHMLYLGREYPRGEPYYRAKLRAAFRKQKDVTDPRQIEMLIVRAEFVSKEIEALYMLRKYRALKRMYYSDSLKSSSAEEKTTSDEKPPEDTDAKK